ncbi:hypothetical protein CC80DRAFT_552846 [Byssothecium circinans]|uniref:Uncharacterized protein n=1 Tax=Byssothecium circinans TaxID=147558 RepID=A0A6A5TIV1_9PLEO|nr:hypothetical protein CC80DRAFT_552846 [Byssothecium circinans]
MDYPEFGTDHERYPGSGIKDRRELEQRFRHEVCKPWLKEYHLQAEVSSLVWANIETEGWKTIGGYKFPCFILDGNARICITGGIALLEIARSSEAWGLVQTFGLLGPQRRWLVVDFFRDDGSHSKQAALQSQHEAVRSILGAATPPEETRPLPYPYPLTRHLKQDAHLASSTVGMNQAFHPLGQLPSMWTTKSFSYLSDIRKSWCNEVSDAQIRVPTWLEANLEQEAINYVQEMVTQWREITLQWHPTVVKSVDPDSIRMLQSRAPQLSKGDRDYVLDTFGRGQILPGLIDSGLRQAVKKAVCQQGPILTMTTFAKDVRLLSSRVHHALAELLTSKQSKF